MLGRNKKSRKDIQDEFDKILGIEQTAHAQGLLGYLTNFKTTVFTDRTVGQEHSGMLCYFVGEDGTSFKVTYKYCPYFYLAYR
jgi:DNA polymerase epsilon subunit 1